MLGYPFKEIEAKWQNYWDTNKTFRVPEKIDETRPKFYVLDMFPYPSGDGLHVGHPEGYTASDIIARYKRMRGFNVLHPIGWDAFGLPTEQFALKTGTHPKITTERNIDRFRKQLKSITMIFQHQDPECLQRHFDDRSTYGGVSSGKNCTFGILAKYHSFRPPKRAVPSPIC